MARTTTPINMTTGEPAELPIKIIKKANCKSLEGSATLTYQIGLDDNGKIYFKIAGNTGGGFYSKEWVAFNDIQSAFKAWPAGTPTTSMALRPLFHGKSVNTPSFMLAVLTAVKLLEPMPNRKRVHQTRDPADFLASVDKLKAGAGMSAKKPGRKPRVKAPMKTAAKAEATKKARAPAGAKATSQAKAAPKAKAKSPKRTSAKTPRKTAAKNSKNP